MKQLLLALCLLVGVGAQAQPNGNLQWVQAFSDINAVMDVATDVNGDVYLTGRVSGTLRLGSTQLTAPGGLSLYVAKCRPSGEVVWATQLPSSALALGYRVQVDARGNSYVAGSFQGTLSYGRNQQITSQTPASGEAGFLLKCNAAGQVQWVQQISASGTELYSTCSAWAVALDVMGNAYLTGTASGSQVHIGNFTFANRQRQTYLASYTPQGTVRWAHMWQSAADFGGNVGRAIALDNFGNCYVSGNHIGGMQLAGQSIPANNSQSLFLAKFDTRRGQLQWLQAPAAFGDGNSLAADRQGNVYLTGWFSGSRTFGNKTATSHGGTDVAVVRYNRDGRVAWATALGGPSDDYDGDLAVSPRTGKVFVSGILNLSSEGTNQAFWVQLQPSGQPMRPVLVGGPGTSSTGMLALDARENVYMTGVFTGTCQFGNTTLQSTFTSGYLARYGHHDDRSTPPVAETPAAPIRACSVYPNPTREQFTLRLEGHTGPAARAVLLNLVGRQVAEQTLLPAGAITETTFSTAQLPVGMYILRVEHGRQVLTHAVSVQ
ncbi:T9SS C-terminal target domain-containing protein [Hymenobacter oligotrophus]|uniref:T9SS C-terminal target domain-containing protein n=1 Tax=Hymenobacter oligotrophus TaxID=2319843 RepID=A0A3B7R3L9_9BACT|nr:T9SS type A sorting domain-containing protein [Hymenobacter oligotrophus]AYA38704.1 T9SS C-terminal target domain-containing protein [Hymenobacter oligotrophus]